MTCTTSRGGSRPSASARAKHCPGPNAWVLAAPEQVALAGFGAVVERPLAVDGLLSVRPLVTATLSADHRTTNGAVGARYLTAVGRLLQNPEEL